ncbi:MAG: dihydroorotase [Ndongobacter sp.]|nr:dihydroorotase [Ndongobacter sp.]
MTRFVARNFLLENVTLWKNGRWQPGSLLVRRGRVRGVFDAAHTPPAIDVPRMSGNGSCLFPGFVDVHVHFREPGQEQKETIRSGTAAAAHGGYTCVCTMPNLNPVPDSTAHLRVQLDKIRETASIHVLPYGAITVSEQGDALADLDALAPHVCAFSDDGRGVQHAERMECAMRRAKALGKCIVAHAEDEALVRGGVIHDGEYARAHRHAGNPSESEWKQVERDIDLVRKTGADYHVCHVSTKESIALIRQAQREGLPVTCETAPHYLVLNDALLREDGRFRMNPPIRSAEDQQALLEALQDGTICCIATDHAPHTAAEKSGGLDHSLNGVVGLETAFPILYTKLVRNGLLSLEHLIDCLTARPIRRFALSDVREARRGLPLARGLFEGEAADFTLFDLESEYTIRPEDFRSKGKASPFSGERVFGRCVATYVGGAPVFVDEEAIRREELS